MKAVSPSSKEPLRVLIADDEPPARQRIEQLLRAETEAPTILHAEDGASAIEAIRVTRPDIVFLDVQMPRASGLEVVKSLGPDAMPVTVFITAYHKFAVDAFELAAADYLLKPFSDERFEEAFRRARERVALKDAGVLREQLRLLLEADARGSGTRRYLKRVAVQGKGRMYVVATADIDHIRASGVYAELHVGSRAHLVRASLNSLEAQLDPEEFFRIHRAAIVRLEQVESLIREGGGNCRVQLKTGKTLPVGRGRREDLEARLGKM